MIIEPMVVESTESTNDSAYYPEIPEFESLGNDWNTMLASALDHAESVAKSPRSNLRGNVQLPPGQFTEQPGAFIRGIIQSTSSDRINVKEWIKRIKNEPVKERIIHDIVDCRTDQRYNFVIQKCRELTKRDGFALFVEHDQPHFRHIHIIHNCNFANGCRCSFLQNIPIKKRTPRNSKLLYDVTDEYLQNLFDYLLQEGYSVLKTIIGQSSWALLDKTPGKYKQV